MEKEFLDILKNIEGNLSNNDILQEIATTLNNIEATLTRVLLQSFKSTIK